jgi:hypothetical protein
MTGKPLSNSQVRLLLDIAAGRPIGHHDSRSIQALERRGLVVKPQVDANGKYMPPALTALGKAEVERATVRGALGSSGGRT